MSLALAPELRSLLQLLHASPQPLDQVDATSPAWRELIHRRLARRVCRHLHLTGLGQQALHNTETP